MKPLHLLIRDFLYREDLIRRALRTKWGKEYVEKELKKLLAKRKGKK